MNENYRWSFLTHSVNKQRHNLHSVCAYFKTIDIASNRVVVEPHIGTPNPIWYCWSTFIRQLILAILTVFLILTV